MSDKIIPFTLKDRVFEFSFKLPGTVKMNMTGQENITLESYYGNATAWVPADNKDAARTKLTNMIENIETWLD